MTIRKLRSRSEPLLTWQRHPSELAVLTEEQLEALAERLRGLINLELPGDDFAYALIFIERERFLKNKEPSPVVVSNTSQETMINVVKWTAKSLDNL